MIYCNFTEEGEPAELKITGKGKDIRDELSAIFIELLQTGMGEQLIYDALHKSIDPEWEEIFDKEIRQFPDPNRRKV